MSLSCIWSEGSLDPDNRSHYGIATLLNNALDRAELGFIHRNGFKEMPPHENGAVVIVHGAHEVTTANQVVNNIERLVWSVVIVIGDEASVFPVERLYGNRRKVWVQMPVPGRHDRADRKLICGYPHDTVAFLEHYKGIPRPLDWSYAGQVNHAYRKQCVEVLRSMHNGFLFESPTFWNGIPRDEYYKVLAQSKLVACPPGANTPDTLRVAEALEAGCIPVADDRWPPGYPRSGNPGMMGYWRYVLGEEPPFPLIRDWREFPGVLAQQLAEGPEKADRIQTWWHGYKGRMREWLRDDVTAVMN